MTQLYARDEVNDSVRFFDHCARPSRLHRAGSTQKAYSRARLGGVRPRNVRALRMAAAVGGSVGFGVSVVFPRSISSGVITVSAAFEFCSK